MAEQQRPQQVRIRELEKFSLYAKASPDQQQQSRLAWSERDGNPRITVYTNLPNDTERYGIIYAAMNPEIFFASLQLLKNIAIGPNGSKMKVNCYTGARGDDGKPTGEKILLSDLLMGKDDNGIVWLSVVSGNRPKIKFEFKISDYHNIVKSDGTPLEAGECSSLIALSTIDRLIDIYTDICAGFRQPKASRVADARPSQSSTPKASSSNLSFDSLDDVM